MYNKFYFSLNVLPFLGGITSNYVAKNLSPKQYYHIYYKDSTVVSLLSITASALKSADIVSKNYNNLSIPYILTIALVNIGYGYNIYSLSNNISTDVVIEENEKNVKSV